MNKYQRQVPSTTIDIYDVLKAWGVTCPATQQAIKKRQQARKMLEKIKELESLIFECSTIGACK